MIHLEYFIENPFSRISLLFPILVNTLLVALQQAESRYGYKSNIFVLSDGAPSQNWCLKNFALLPLTVEKYSRGRVITRFQWDKKVRGHGKGQIDSCHAEPKKVIREYIYRHAAADRANPQNPILQDLIGGFQTGQEVVNFLQNPDDNENFPKKFNRIIPRPVDPSGFVLQMRSVYYYNGNTENAIYQNVHGSQKCHVLQLQTDGPIINHNAVYMAYSPCVCTPGRISCDPSTPCQRRITDPDLGEQYYWHIKNVGRRALAEDIAEE
jgi:hypothetical protein